MKHQDGMDESRDYFVDSLIDDAIENERSRTLHQKGRLLKERCARVIGTEPMDATEVATLPGVNLLDAQDGIWRLAHSGQVEITKDWKVKSTQTKTAHPEG